MNDETLIRLLEDACKKLEGVHFPVETPHLTPIYNGLLAAARTNHPGDRYLGVLLPLMADASPGPEELNILLGQLRIVLETLQAEKDESPEEDSDINGTAPTLPTGSVPAPIAAPVVAGRTEPFTEPLRETTP